MTTRAFIVCEDHTLDQYVVVPVVKQLMAEIGRPRAVVKAVTNPRLTGISDVQSQFVDLATRYALIGDIVIFAVDRDAMDGGGSRGDRQAALAAKVALLPPDVAAKTVVVLAIEELEVWAIWGAKSVFKESWADIRRERDPKELYFDALLSAADRQQPGAGRARLIRESLNKGWSSLVAGCPELKQLELDVAAIV